ncbi:hypothetical protein SAMN04488128_101873 [Chitinophaga eiseniae]|uniref:Uncharacterized protein n=1 Tax=Chitinophaga eiseniae TaxID=634771 RepID=A0A1T4LZK3_9BACT|nr:hypothetical protein [Chitinophaga eiseniae]SJZ60085.1 hypothetical protein SAMN04488128_101873 [Chitinophaga eiseniae]
MDKKSLIIKIVSGYIEMLEARTDRDEYENDILEALQTLCDGAAQMDSEKALDWWLDVMWEIITDLGLHN